MQLFLYFVEFIMLYKHVYLDNISSGEVIQKTQCRNQNTVVNYFHVYWFAEFVDNR